jgi:hypothetical protein
MSAQTHFSDPRWNPEQAALGDYQDGSTDGDRDD